MRRDRLYDFRYAGVMMYALVIMVMLPSLVWGAVDADTTQVADGPDTSGAAFDTVDVEVDVQAVDEPDMSAAITDTVDVEADVPDALLAPDMRVLSLEECLGIAGKKSPSMRKARQSLIRARANLTAANAPYWPNISLSLDAPNYSERTDRIESPALQEIVTSTETDMQYRGTLNVSQRVPMVGRFTVSSFVYDRDLTSTFRTSRRELAADVVLRYEQTLLAPDPVEEAASRARLSLESVERSYDRREVETSFQLMRAYYDLIRKMRQVEIQQETVEQSRSLYDIASKKLEAGLIAEVQALKLQVDLARAESELSSAMLDVEYSKDVLKQTIGLPFDEDFTIETEVTYAPVRVDLDRAIDMGLQNRSELREAEIQYRLQGMTLAERRREGLPSPTLNGFYGLKGLGEEPEDIAESFDRNQWGVYLKVDVPIWDSGLNAARVRAARADLRSAEVDLEEARRSLILEIKDAVRRLEEAENRVKILAASVDVARKSFEITQQKFGIGAAESQELLDAQVALTRARTNSLNALMDYQLAQAALKRATMVEIEELVAE